MNKRSIKYIFQCCGILGLSVLCFMVQSSCTSPEESKSDQAHSKLNLWEDSTLDLFLNGLKATEPSYITALDGEGNAFGFFDKRSCEKGRAFVFSTSVDSVFGSTNFLFSSSDKGIENFVIINDSRLKLTNSFPKVDQSVLSDICNDIDKKETVTLNEFASGFQATLSEYTSDCKLTINKTTTDIKSASYSCGLESQSPRQARSELKAIRRNMVMKWNRQPYLLARRLAATDQLAKALLSANSEKDILYFCKIVDSSQPEELPLIMNSTPWKKAICQYPDPKTRSLAARVSLKYALSEIRFLKRLFEKTSRLGHLRVRVPKSDAPSRNLWVTLTPKQSVTERLAQETEKLRPKKLENMVVGCWHPAIGNNRQILSFSSEIGLIPTTNKDATCQDEDINITDSYSPTTAYRYLADSITSETEFIITNGLSKVLRLPNGEYNYELRGHSDDPESWDSGELMEKRTLGQIDWEKRRPYATISAW